jgi:hypothetical protein
LNKLFDHVHVLLAPAVRIGLGEKRSGYIKHYVTTHIAAIAPSSCLL